MSRRTITANVLAAAALALAGSEALRSDPPPVAIPAWAAAVGARPEQTGPRRFRTNDYGAIGDGTTDSTAAIQRAIDACAAAGGGTVTFGPGSYVTGALFVKSGVHFDVPRGVSLLGSQDEQDYPIQPARVAGIDMDWPAALINVRGQRNVVISGRGTIDGRGEIWWRKYWALRRDYERRGLRWAADYDCRRVRLLVVWESQNVEVSGLHLRRSGFWTVQLVYSSHLTVDGVRITDNTGPSTDGIDVDSSREVLVQHCDIDDNDDDICLKAGRDADGLRVGRPTEYVVVRYNLIRHGAGMLSIGSETSGGIRHVVAYHNEALGTSNGLVLKSALTRGGGASDILFRDAVMGGVGTAFSFTLNWNPAYSYARIPSSVASPPSYWRTLATPVVPADRGWASFYDITVANVRISARRIFAVAGTPQRPIGPVRMQDVIASAATTGELRNTRGWSMQNVRISVSPSPQ